MHETNCSSAFSSLVASISFVLLSSTHLGANPCRPRIPDSLPTSGRGCKVSAGLFLIPSYQIANGSAHAAATGFSAVPVDHVSGAGLALPVNALGTAGSGPLQLRLQVLHTSTAALARLEIISMPGGLKEFSSASEVLDRYSSIPEPASLSLMGMVLIGFALLFRVRLKRLVI
jgi:hypothetical protein